jgi:hypothetical protein
MCIPLVVNIVHCIVYLISFGCRTSHIAKKFHTRYNYHLVMLSWHPKFHTSNSHFIAVLPWRFGDAQSSPRGRENALVGYRKDQSLPAFMRLFFS